SDLCQWWKQFNDPLLDALIAQAVQANFDFRIAIEKIVQARAQYRVERSYLWPEFDIDATIVRSRNSQTLFPSNSATASPATSQLAPSTGSFLPVFQNFFQVGFDAIWEFDLFGKFR